MWDEKTSGVIHELVQIGQRRDDEPNGIQENIRKHLFPTGWSTGWKRTIYSGGLRIRVSGRLYLFQVDVRMVGRVISPLLTRSLH